MCKESELIFIEPEECDHVWMTEFAIPFCFSCGAPQHSPSEPPASQPPER